MAFRAGNPAIGTGAARGGRPGIVYYGGKNADDDSQWIPQAGGMAGISVYNSARDDQAITNAGWRNLVGTGVPNPIAGQSTQGVYLTTTPAQAPLRPLPKTRPLVDMSGVYSEKLAGKVATAESLQVMSVPLVTGVVDAGTDTSENPDLTGTTGENLQRVLKRGTDYSLSYSLCDQTAVGMGAQTLGAATKTRGPLSEANTGGGGFTLRSFSLIGTIGAPLGVVSSLCRLTILYGPALTLPPILSTTWQPSDFAQYREGLEPARFLYDQWVNPATDLININVNVCTLRLGGVQYATNNTQADIRVYVTSVSPFGRVELRFSASYINHFIPALTYPQTLDKSSLYWLTDLDAKTDDLGIDYNEWYENGMYWPVEWRYRLSSTGMLLQLPGMAVLFSRLGPRAEKLFRPPEKETTVGVETAGGKELGIDLRVSGGYPALGLTDFNVGDTHKILGFKEYQAMHAMESQGRILQGDKERRYIRKRGKHGVEIEREE